MNTCNFVPFFTFLRVILLVNGFSGIDDNLLVSITISAPFVVWNEFDIVFRKNSPQRAWCECESEWRCMTILWESERDNMLLRVSLKEKKSFVARALVTGWPRS